MKSPVQRLGSVIGLTVLVALAPVVSFALVHAEQDIAPADLAGNDAAVTSPSLHNPNFDNGHWYEFDNRYDNSYPSGAWVPAGTDMYDTIQDWRIWFLDGTDIVDCDPEEDRVHSGSESAKMRSFEWSPEDRQVAGLYQVIADVEPCSSYKFQMYAYSRQQDSNDWLADLKVGIDPTGWHPDSADDPAVHEWPSTIVWGTSHTEYDSTFGPLEVTAEALETEITVFLYADARGGVSHKIYWDTGTFESVTTSGNLLADPDERTVDTSGITSGPGIGIYWPNEVRVDWSTSAIGSNQVYYRCVTGGTSSPPTTNYTHTVHLPLVQRSFGPWLWTDVEKATSNDQEVIVRGLESGSTCEYFVVTRASWNNDCALWVSNVDTFTTP